MSFAALTVDINARTANLESGIDRLKAKTSGLDEFGKKLGLSLAGLGGVAAAAGAGMVALARQVADLQDSASKMSQRIGIGVEALNELQYAASLADVDTELLANAMTRLSIRISEAISGNKESAAIFDTLGIAIKDASGQARAADEVFADVADRFQQFEDGTNKTAQAAELFDFGGRLLLVVAEPTTLDHQEHASIEIAPGAYWVVRQREYHPQEIRRVQD